MLSCFSAIMPCSPGRCCTSQNKPSHELNGVLGRLFQSDFVHCLSAKFPVHMRQLWMGATASCPVLMHFQNGSMVEIVPPQVVGQEGWSLGCDALCTTCFIFARMGLFGFFFSYILLRLSCFVLQTAQNTIHAAVLNILPLYQSQYNQELFQLFLTDTCVWCLELLDWCKAGWNSTLCSLVWEIHVCLEGGGSLLMESPCNMNQAWNSWQSSIVCAARGSPLPHW